MSLRLYFGNLQDADENIKTQPENVGGVGKYASWEDVVRFHGVKLRKDQGTWATDAFDLEDLIPEKITSIITRASVQDYINQGPESSRRRESGFYKGENDVEAVIRGGSLKIYGSSVDNVRKLHRAILSGNIVPTESFEEDQPSRPRADIEKDLMAAQASRGQLQEALIKAQAQMELLTGDRLKYSRAYEQAIVGLKVIDMRLRNSGTFIRSKPLHDLIGTQIDECNILHLSQGE